MKPKTFRHDYVIGDVQGCFSALENLLTTIQFDATKDRLWFAGDLVARGENSLAVLRLIKQLHEMGSAETVLGNHDLNLLAVWRGFTKLKKKDNTASIFEVDDCDELMNWLRCQPLLHAPNAHTLLCHAGIPPIWTTEQAIELANEVMQVVCSDLDTLDKFLPAMYGKEPTRWQDSLKGEARLRCIANYFTRMRLCTVDGELEFRYKKNPYKDSEAIPVSFKPWYAWQTDIAKQRKEKIFFGHWAALNAKIATKNAQSTDAACVWGGELLAYRLNDNRMFFAES